MGEIPCTPARTVNDAQHGILRQIDSVSKRRKVAFISPSVENIETFDVDTDSSTELEIEVSHQNFVCQTFIYFELHYIWAT